MDLFLGEKHFKLTWKLRIEIKIPSLFNISVLLDVQANLPETNQFFVFMAWVSTFSNVCSTWDV